MFMTKRVAALKEEVAVLRARLEGMTEENGRLRAQLELYNEAQRQQLEEQQRVGRQWDKLMDYTGGMGNEDKTEA